MGHDHAARLKRIAEEAGAAGWDGVVFAPGPDLLYLGGYDPPPLERLTALVIRPAAEPILIVPRLEQPRAMESPVASLCDVTSWRDGESAHALIAGILGEGSSGRIGVSDRMWAGHLLSLQRAMPATSFEPASDALRRLRSIKDREEIELLARAGAAADEAFTRIIGEGLSGRAEVDVAVALARYLLDAGHDSVSFTIVGSGPNGASPHHEPGGRVVERGDAVVLDFGGRVGGYGSDLTRTVFVGDPTEKMREVHEVVRRAQRAAVEAVRPGVAAQDVDRIARSVIEDAGYGPDFIHRTGHGIGLEEHEDPYIVEGNEERLQPGMAFSVEPGIYLAGRFGVRIEDIVVVTDDSVRNCNVSPYGPTVVD